MESFAHPSLCPKACLSNDYPPFPLARNTPIIFFLSGCPSLSSPSFELNATVNQTYFGYPVVVKLTCFHGYTLSQDLSVLKCNESGQWNPPPRPCWPMACNLTAFAGQNAILTNVTPSEGFVNSTASFSCKTGFETAPANHSPTLNCTVSRDDKAMWSPKDNLPLCLPVSCGDPPLPLNGTVTAQSNSFMSIAAYKCDAGFNLSDSKPRICMANKSWSGETPNCTGKKECISEQAEVYC